MTLYRMVLKIPKNRRSITGIRMHNEPIKAGDDAGNVIICGPRTDVEQAFKLSSETAKHNWEQFVSNYGKLYDYEIFECELED